MGEKIKKILLNESKYRFRILVFILIALMLVLVYVLWVFNTIEIDWENIRKINWEAISAIALIVTAIIIAIQAYQTKKQAGFSAKNIAFLAVPGVSFFVRSLKTAYKRERRIDEWKVLPSKEKLRTQFIVQSNSKTPILFKVKIILKLDNKKLSLNHYWNNPLSINPGITRYPNVINLEKIITDEELKNIIENKEDKKIFVEIKYKYTPKFVEAYSEPILEYRKFNLKEFVWEGPDGIKDENIYLPGEK